MLLYFSFRKENTIIYCIVTELIPDNSKAIAQNNNCLFFIYLSLSYLSSLSVLSLLHLIIAVYSTTIINTAQYYS